MRRLLDTTYPIKETFMVIEPDGWVHVVNCWTHGTRRLLTGLLTLLEPPESNERTEP